MKFVSVVIPTFNRFEELVKTIPQIATYIDNNSELIIFDQSNNYNPNDKQQIIEKILSNINFKYYHSDTPSVTLAWNTSARLAKGDIVLFLDDDIDINFDIIDAHRKKYDDRSEVIGVAGGYYASSYDRVWIPSSNKAGATTLAGVNVSFLTSVFKLSGAASAYKKPFAPFDWEIAEYFSYRFGKLLVGDDILVFHRAPETGGCENQSERGVDWYYGCYHNHFLWILTRSFPRNITRLPRHFYWLFKYCLPKKSVLLSFDFFYNALCRSIIDAIITYRRSDRCRENLNLPPNSFRLICSSTLKE